MHATDLGVAAVLAAAIGCGVFIVSRANISRFLRMWLSKNKRIAESFHGRRRAWVWGKLHELAGCPFCLSVWMAGMAVFLYHVRLVHGYGPLDWLVTAFAVSAASMLPVHIIDLAVAPSMMPPPRLPERKTP